MNKTLPIIVALIALTAGYLVYQQFLSKAKPEFALYYENSREIKPFTMTDQQGKVFDQQSLMGKWSWLFLGYTSCPDVCPTTLQELNFIYPELKAIAPNNQVILITADPKRDTQKRLKEYIAYFNKEFIAIRAGHEILFPFARNLGLMYAITGESDQINESAASNEVPADYLVDHSASIVLVNPQGRISAIFKPKQELGQMPIIRGDELVSDFAKIFALAEK